MGYSSSDRKRGDRAEGPSSEEWGDSRARRGAIQPICRLTHPHMLSNCINPLAWNINLLPKVLDTHLP